MVKKNIVALFIITFFCLTAYGADQKNEEEWMKLLVDDLQSGVSKHPETETGSSSCANGSATGCVSPSSSSAARAAAAAAAHSAASSLSAVSEKEPFEVSNIAVIRCISSQKKEELLEQSKKENFNAVLEDVKKLGALQATVALLQNAHVQRDEYLLRSTLWVEQMSRQDVVVARNIPLKLLSVGVKKSLYGDASSKKEELLNIMTEVRAKGAHQNLLQTINNVYCQRQTLMVDCAKLATHKLFKHALLEKVKAAEAAVAGNTGAAQPSTPNAGASNGSSSSSAGAAGVAVPSSIKKKVKAKRKKK